MVDKKEIFPLTLSERKRGWWIEERATVPCALPPDGLIVVFMLRDVEIVLDQHYPSTIQEGRKVWYFNESRDREIAEQAAYRERVVCNPQVLWNHFFSK